MPTCWQECHAQRRRLGAAYLATTQGSQSKSGLLGDIYGKTVSATFTVTGTSPVFWYNTADNPCGTPSSVRLFFQTRNKGGSFVETNYWWSNPISYQLASDGTAITLNAVVSGANWSDLYGHFGTGTYASGFEHAASNVTMIGLAFGGGCCFANGVGLQSGTATFHLDSYNVTDTPPLP